MQKMDASCKQQLLVSCMRKCTAWQTGCLVTNVVNGDVDLDAAHGFDNPEHATLPSHGPCAICFCTATYTLTHDCAWRLAALCTVLYDFCSKWKCWHSPPWSFRLWQQSSILPRSTSYTMKGPAVCQGGTYAILGMLPVNRITILWLSCKYSLPPALPLSFDVNWWCGHVDYMWPTNMFSSAALDVGRGISTTRIKQGSISNSRWDFLDKIHESTLILKIIRWVV